MFKDYYIVDNIFEDPDSIVEKSCSLHYYKDTDVDKPNGKWAGQRTKIIDDIDANFFNDMFVPILSTLRFNDEVDIEYSVESYFHLLGSDKVPTNDWFHKDQALLAGIVYLNKNPPSLSGTTLIINNNKLYIENVYNRLIIYNAGLEHAPTNSFDVRKTLTFFINGIKIT
jgi:hypothetical protein